jgi:hypothetical protein
MGNFKKPNHFDNKGSGTLAKFVGVNVSDIVPSLLALAIRIISICVALPKVAKASTIVTVVCRCHWHFHLKNIANGNTA